MNGRVENLNGKIRRNTDCIPYGGLMGDVWAGHCLGPQGPVCLL